MKKILFQGDSITDSGRNRQIETDMGCGYARLIAAKLGYDFPNDYVCYNCGINGNRIVDLYARIKSDIINIAPDYMSILIGVNDVWHEIGQKNGVDVEKFEKIYTMLLEEVYAALPNIKIMLLEPYVLKGPATEGAWETFDKEVKMRSNAVKRIADKFGIPFIQLQNKFDAAVKITNSSAHWAPDGVHPSNAGHELISRAWIEGFEKIK